VGKKEKKIHELQHRFSYRLFGVPAESNIGGALADMTVTTSYRGRSLKGNRTGNLIGTGGPSVCWIDHKTTPFDNLYRGMEKESRKSHPKGREIVEQK